jgi:hypothetical protein
MAPFQELLDDTVAIIIPCCLLKSFALYLVPFRKYNNLKVDPTPNKTPGTAPQQPLKQHHQQ